MTVMTAMDDGAMTTTREGGRPSPEEVFRRLAIGDRTLASMLAGPDAASPWEDRLDALTNALVRIAVLVPLDAPQSSYQSAVGAAVRAGATLDDLLAVLFATVESVGTPRVTAAASRIALAAGYDVDAALERVDGREG
jgi:alkylhydroperoxidase/carboxymuconolactone decarboxylase family protein YurZ